MTSMRRRFLGATVCLSLLVVPGNRAGAQGVQPIDLFADEPRLAPDHIRVAGWNLRHIDVEADTAVFLPGATREEDFEILTATFAKAISDLGLDLVAVVEHQPHAGEPDRLVQILTHLNAGQPTSPWRSDETRIPYDDPSDPYGNLQLGVLWDSRTVSIDPAANVLLDDLRQPRDASGQLVNRRLRIPWLVPVAAGDLGFDLLVLHLKSGGAAPQADEVDAIEGWISSRLSAADARPLVVLGDWNIRPDQGTGRNRLRQMEVQTTAGPLMRVLTVEQISPSLDQWEQLGSVAFGSPEASIVPFTHFNATTVDTFLDHVAISTSLAPAFHDPVAVTLTDGTADLREGIRIARPLVPEPDYTKLTDHLPVVVILATDHAIGGGGAPAPASLQIVALLPNPAVDEDENEEAHLRNAGGQIVPLEGWRLRDAADRSWVLDPTDGSILPGETKIVRRRGRPMSMTNGGDTIRLIAPAGSTVDEKSYGPTGNGEFVVFP